MPITYVVYYRVSDVKQGQSGLGLEAQQAMFRQLLTTRPGTLVAEYTEVETGKTLRKSLRRPQLQKAIAHAREAGATLVIAKIDRLARNVAFISTLMESKLPIVCCDMPEADQFTLHILAALAEREGRMISDRTCAALAVLKTHGVKLGSHREGHWDGLTKKGESMQKRREIGLQRAQKTIRDNAEEEMARCYEPLIPWIRDMRESGETLQGIVDQLNAKQCRTRSGQPWNISTLRRVIGKYLGQDYLGQKTGLLNRCKVLA
jgi:DNA invertase Pin-like site-specific DNA recombinase